MSHFTFAALAFAAGALSGLGLPTAIAFCGGTALIALLLKSPVAGASLAILVTLCIGAIEPPRVAGITVINMCLALCLAVLVLQANAGPVHNRVFRWPIWSFMFGVVVLISPTDLSELSGLSTPLLTAAVAYVLLKKNTNSVLWVLGLAGLFHAGIGLFESLTHASITYTGWKDQAAADVGGIRRAASTIGDPNYLGVTLLCAVPGVALITRNWRRIPQVAVWTVYSLSFVLTFSRGAFIGAALAACFFACRKYSYLLRPSRLAAIGLGLLLAASLLAYSPIGQPLLDRFSGVDASTRSRSVLQSAALELFKENWLTGLGIGNLQSHLAPLAHALVPLNAFGASAFLPQTDPLNTYLLVGAEGGILALGLLVSLILAGIAGTLRTALGLASILVGISATAATLDLLQAPMIWCLMVLAIHIQRSGRTGAAESPRLIEGHFRHSADGAFQDTQLTMAQQKRNSVRAPRSQTGDGDDDVVLIPVRRSP